MKTVGNCNAEFAYLLFGSHPFRTENVQICPLTNSSLCAMVCVERLSRERYHPQTGTLSDKWGWIQCWLIFLPGGAWTISVSRDPLSGICASSARKWRMKGGASQSLHVACFLESFMQCHYQKYTYVLVLATSVTIAHLKLHSPPAAFYL